MTVPNEIPRNDYIANGIVKKFSVTFDYEVTDTLRIKLNGKEPPTDKYYIDDVDHSFNFYLPPSNGDIIYIYRETPLERDIDYDNNYNSFRPKTVNTDFDRVWRAIQEYMSAIVVDSENLEKEVLDRIKADEDMLDYIMNQDNSLKKDYISRDALLKKYIDDMIALVTGDPSFNGIDDLQVTTLSGLTQRSENKEFITTIEDYSGFNDLYAEDGRTVFVKHSGKTYKLDNSTIITGDSLYVDSKGRKWVGFGSVHKTTNSYGLKPITEQVSDAFIDSTYVEIPSGNYADKINQNKYAYSFGNATTKQTGLAVTNIVDGVRKSESISRGSMTASRWDLAFAYPQKTGISYHPFPSGFYIMPNRSFYYVWHKPDTGYTATLVKKTMTNVIVSEVNFPDTAPQGETFTILGDKMYVGGRLQDPKFHVYNASTGLQEDYFLWGGVTFTSRQFAYLDPLDQDRIIVFARKSGIGFGLFEYRRSLYTVENGVKTLTLIKELTIPNIDESVIAIQGFTAIGDTAYLLVENPTAPANRLKKIHCYRLTDGTCFDIRDANPNGLYRTNAQYGDAGVADGNYESEGIQAQINTSSVKSNTSLFIGLITGTGADTVETKYRFLVFRSALGGENEMTPIVQGLPIRGGSNSAVPTSAGGYIQQYYITLHKLNGSWQVQQDNYENSTGLHTVQKVAIEDFNGTPVLAFYLLNVFLVRLYGACSSNRFDFRALLDRNSYGGSTGGATSSRQVVIFADNTGALVPPSSVTDGTRIEISLTVISG